MNISTLWSFNISKVAVISVLVSRCESFKDTCPIAKRSTESELQGVHCGYSTAGPSFCRLLHFTWWIRYPISAGCEEEGRGSLLPPHMPRADLDQATCSEVRHATNHATALAHKVWTLKINPPDPSPALLIPRVRMSFMGSQRGVRRGVRSSGQIRFRLAVDEKLIHMLLSSKLEATTAWEDLEVSMRYLGLFSASQVLREVGNEINDL